MPDSFVNQGAGLDSPAFDAASVTPNDGADLAFTARALYVGGAGDVTAILKGDAVAVTFKNVAGGTILPVAARRVMSTGTTATFIVALW
jgi:hypothetical protein